MQLPTHIIAGILIQEFITTTLNINHLSIRFLLIVIFCFLSHFILDPVALLTYHPPQRENTKFWLYWHLFVYNAGIILFIIFFNPYWLGMICANAVDLWDWYFLRPLGNKLDKPLQQQYGLHFLVNRVRQPLINLGVPNLSHSRIGILPELISTCIFLVLGLMKVFG